MNIANDSYFHAATEALRRVWSATAEAAKGIWLNFDWDRNSVAPTNRCTQ